MGKQAKHYFVILDAHHDYSQVLFCPCLVAGLANVASSFVGSYPVTGSFSRYVCMYVLMCISHD